MIRAFTLTTAALLATALFALHPPQTNANHGSTPGQVDLIAIDVDPTGNAPNGPLGPIDACREVAVGETFTIDVVVDEIDPSDGLEGFQFIIRYSAGMEFVGYSFDGTIIGSGEGSDLIDLSDTQVLPDADGTFFVAAVDLGGPPETSVEAGTGVLVHVQMQAPAPIGAYVEVLETLLVNKRNEALTLNAPIGASVLSEGSCSESGADPDNDGSCSPDETAAYCTGSDNCPGVHNPDQSNGDADIDGDACDSCPSVSGGSLFDNDSDGVADLCDNCDLLFNSDQLDSDSDGFGDLCDRFDITLLEASCPAAAYAFESFECVMSVDVTNDTNSQIDAMTFLEFGVLGPNEFCTVEHADLSPDVVSFAAGSTITVSLIGSAHCATTDEAVALLKIGVAIPDHPEFDVWISAPHTTIRIDDPPDPTPEETPRVAPSIPAATTPPLANSGVPSGLTPAALPAAGGRQPADSGATSIPSAGLLLVLLGGAMLASARFARRRT